VEIVDVYSVPAKVELYPLVLRAIGGAENTFERDEFFDERRVHAIALHAGTLDLALSRYAMKGTPTSGGNTIAPLLEQIRSSYLTLRLGSSTIVSDMPLANLLAQEVGFGRALKFSDGPILIDWTRSYVRCFSATAFPAVAPFAALGLLVYYEEKESDKKIKG